MNKNSVKDTPVGLNIQLNSYDVVLLSSTDGSPCLVQGKQYVGNRRFRVLLSLYRQRYLQADMFGDEYEMYQITQDVLDTVSNKCVPNGRFFQQCCDNRYQQLDCASPSPITIIRTVLKRCYNSSGSDLPQDEPKLHQDFVGSPNPFDVVCEADGLGISQDGFTGNNRLRVMLDIRGRSKEASTQKGKQRIADEVVSSIIDDASGHFLRIDKQSGKYKVLSRTAAMACIINTLDKPANFGKKRSRKTEVKKLAPFETIINAAISRQAARSRYNRAA